MTGRQVRWRQRRALRTVSSADVSSTLLLWVEPVDAPTSQRWSGRVIGLSASVRPAFGGAHGSEDEAVGQAPAGPAYRFGAHLSGGRTLFMYSLPVRLLLDGSFGSGSLVNVLSWFFAFGTFFNGVQYRVFTLGSGPVEIGLSCMSMAILSIVVGALGPRLARRQGDRVVLVAGLVLMAAGSIGIAAAATTATYWPVAIAEVLASVGSG